MEKLGWVGSVCLLAACGHALAQSPNNPNFVVDGLALGGTVSPGSALYQSYKCRPSEDFSGFAWCTFHHDLSSKSGHYTSWVSFLHSADNTAVFVTQAIIPAFFQAGDADREIQRLTRLFGQPAQVLNAPQTADHRHALLASWGTVTLTPLDDATVEALRRGEVIHQGLLADYIGNARKSASSGLPIYKLGGGPGYLWAADFDDAGKGSLQVTVVDASALDDSTRSQPTSAPVANAHSPSPILSPDAPKLIVVNNSCLNITDVIIDGAHQATGVSPGGIGNFHMDYRCMHTLDAASSDTHWNQTIQCNGRPYDNYSQGLNGPNHADVASFLNDGSLIAEKSSNGYLGQFSLTSKSDCLVVEKLSFNRGNCNSTSVSLPKALKFGQTIDGYYYCAKLLELNVSTDQGTELFTWAE
jgi:hypothetical protein